MLLQAIGESTDGAATWAERDASAACMPPPGTTAVIDMCGISDLPVREGYETYGSAAFFGRRHTLLGIWIEADKRMYSPPRASTSTEGTGSAGTGPTAAVEAAEWEFAMWHVKCSLLYCSFSVTHLTNCHLLVSNTLLIATREALCPGHPVRQLVWPFLLGAVSINAAVNVRLLGQGGAIVRLSAHSSREVDAFFKSYARSWRYESFDEYTTRRMGDGCFGGDLEPVMEDGRRLWSAIEKFVRDYLSLHYRRSAAVGGGEGVTLLSGENDSHLSAFWKTADRCAMPGEDGRPLGLPPLSFDSLAAYITQ